MVNKHLTLGWFGTLIADNSPSSGDKHFQPKSTTKLCHERSEEGMFAYTVIERYEPDVSFKS